MDVYDRLKPCSCYFEAVLSFKWLLKNVSLYGSFDALEVWSLLILDDPQRPRFLAAWYTGNPVDPPVN
jgi:hypothetical protein